MHTLLTGSSSDHSRSSSRVDSGGCRGNDLLLVHGGEATHVDWLGGSWHHQSLRCDILGREVGRKY